MLALRCGLQRSSKSNQVVGEVLLSRLLGLKALFGSKIKFLWRGFGRLCAAEELTLCQSEQEETHNQIFAPLTKSSTCSRCNFRSIWWLNRLHSHRKELGRILELFAWLRLAIVVIALLLSIDVEAGGIGSQRGNRFGHSYMSLKLGNIFMKSLQIRLAW